MDSGECGRVKETSPSFLKYLISTILLASMYVRWETKNRWFARLLFPELLDVAESALIPKYEHICARCPVSHSFQKLNAIKYSGSAWLHLIMCTKSTFFFFEFLVSILTLKICFYLDIQTVHLFCRFCPAGHQLYNIWKKKILKGQVVW